MNGIVYGLPNVVWVGLIFYLLTHPNVAAKWGSMLSSLFASISKRAERATVALDIQGRIGSFSKAMNSQVAGIMPHGLRIEWAVGKTSRDDFIKDGKVIVRMNYHRNEDANVVNATVQYLAKGLLPESRPHIDDKIMRAATLICTKKMLESERKTALPFYYSEVLGPARTSDQDLDNYVVAMQGLDELGYFTNILLYELQGLGVKLAFAIPDESTKEEHAGTSNRLWFNVIYVIHGTHGVLLCSASEPGTTKLS